MGTHPIFESDFDCLTDAKMEPREAARRISRAWLAYRDRQIFRILASVLSVANEGQDGALLARLSPNEAALFDPSRIVLKMRLAGEQFPPKVVFKICLKKASICYLNGRNELKKDVEGALRLMGERNYLQQLTSDLIERQQNKHVVDLIDIGTGEDYARFCNYQEKSDARIGGKDNHWRTVDLEALPRAAPLRDLFELIDTASISSLPRKFWTLPKNRAHFETQVTLLLNESKQLTIPKPRQKSSKQSSTTPKPPPSWNHSIKADSIKLASFDAEFDDYEARELYEWSQFL